MPGGCNIGPRRIDFHIRGLEKLGATVEIDHGFIKVHSSRLRGAAVSLDYPSVGATENLLMAATAADGVTVIENAAREPEIADLCAFLSGMGAVIEGAGSSTIRIEGGHALHGVDHEVIADRVEAGTYLVMGAATGGDVTVEGLDPAHLELFLAKLRSMGVDVEEGPRRIRVRREGPLSPVDISTLPHPGFATDLQAQFYTLRKARRLRLGQHVIDHGLNFKMFTKLVCHVRVGALDFVLNAVSERRVATCSILLDNGLGLLW